MFVIVLNLGGNKQSLNINEHFDMGRTAEVITSSMQSGYHDGWVRGKATQICEFAFVGLAAVLFSCSINGIKLLRYIYTISYVMSLYLYIFSVIVDPKKFVAEPYVGVVLVKLWDIFRLGCILPDIWAAIMPLLVLNNFIESNKA